jgi:hypothetical protein
MVATIYRPKHQRQINPNDPYGKYNCTAYAAAIAVDRATIGGCLITGKEVRANSTEPKPSPRSPGLNLVQGVGGAFRATHVGMQVRRISWSAMLVYLKNRGVILQGDYDQMSGFSCQTSFRDNHAVFLNNTNTDPVTIADVEYGPGKCALTYDPLCTGYKWVPLTVLRKYAEKFALQQGFAGVLCATTRSTPLIA